MTTFFMILVGYLLGSVPWALVIGKLFYNKDIRLEGSKNLGASNAGRVLGKKAAIAVTILDAMKAFFSMYIATFFAKDALVFVGLACCIGHCFPIFAQFHGGKAVATSFGFFLGISCFITQQYMLNFLLPIVCFFAILYFTKMVSVASMSALFIESIICFFVIKDINLGIAAFALWVFVCYRHKANILRIKNGTENKIKWM